MLLKKNTRYVDKYDKYVVIPGTQMTLALIGKVYNIQVEQLQTSKVSEVSKEVQILKLENIVFLKKKTYWCHFQGRSP